ncbi:hypothetical protein HDF16_001829 [Granulicella aggregans]|uniref:Glycerophosphoryl diester phosphodiesterase family protein n=1 Tax=Granulicella aggregans TaxID=474949 RepID=A0A7W7ZC14_9BACT|nr:hypothetical protein [Granulicella aggregans]MBB5057144.1 hypothetical protein [Granulicella aggregans]
MADQAWFTADGSGGDGLVAAPPPPVTPAQSRYELRPLTTGELLDRTFFLYRSNFWLFVGLASIAAGIHVVMELFKLLFQYFFGVVALGSVTGPAANAGSIGRSAAFVALSLVASVLYFAVYGVTQAATTSAVSAIYLGDATSMKIAFRAVSARWARFFGISLWQLWSAGWIFTLLIIPPLVIFGLGMRSKMGIAGLMFFLASLSLIYGTIAYIRNSFGVPAAVMENLKARVAMRRSKVLTAGSKGRIFLLFVFIMVLYFVVLAIQSPLLVLLVQTKGPLQLLLGQALGLVIGFFASAAIGPVGAIGLCLFYIDQRIRKEGFDIEFLLERSGPPPVVAEFTPPLESIEMPVVHVADSAEQL